MENEKDVERDDAQISGRTDGPFGSDDTDVDVRKEDNKHRYEQEDSANGLDSMQVRGGQDGRNNRGVSSTDMDSKNGVLRMGDTDNSTMEVTPEAESSITGNADKTNTSTVDVTTSGPDDDGSADQTPAPKAQEAAKDQDADKADEWQQNNDKEIAETGTDLSNQPTY